MSQRIALFPGSFDPFTNGHLDTVRRAADLFDEVIIAVMTNTSKKAMFAGDEKLNLIRQSVSALTNVQVQAAPQKLTVAFARQLGARFLVRGLRNQQDLTFEADVATMNAQLAPDIDTVFLLAAPQYRNLSSSIIKEVASFGGDVSALVPPPVVKALQAQEGVKHDPA